MPITTFPTKRELDKMEPPVIFEELMAEAATWEGGFSVRTPDPVAPTFVENLREQHYPELPSFEVNDDLEAIDETVMGDLAHLIVG